MTIMLTRWATMSCSSRASRRRSSATAPRSSCAERCRRVSWLRPTAQAPANISAGAVRSVSVGSSVRTAEAATAARPIASPTTARSALACAAMEYIDSSATGSRNTSTGSSSASARALKAAITTNSDSSGRRRRHASATVITAAAAAVWSRWPAAISPLSHDSNWPSASSAAATSASTRRGSIWRSRSITERAYAAPRAGASYRGTISRHTGARKDRAGG